MRRQLLWTVGVALVVCAAPLEAYGQNARVDWSTLDMGFASSQSTNVLLCGVVGQSFAGEARAGDTQVQIGFMSDRQTGGPTFSAPEGKSLPVSFSLCQNFPNPFNPTTTIRYQLPGVSDVKLVVYDVLGRELAVLVNERKPAGEHNAVFDANGMASGVYLYRLTAGSFVETRRMLLIR